MSYDDKHSQVWERINMLNSTAAQEAIDSGSQESLELRDMARQLSREAQGGMSPGELSKKADELEQRFVFMKQGQQASYWGDNPRPPYSRSETPLGSNYRRFYGSGSSWYKKDWE